MPRRRLSQRHCNKCGSATSRCLPDEPGSTISSIRLDGRVEEWAARHGTGGRAVRGSSCARVLLGLGADGRPTFLIADPLAENLPDQTAQSVGDGADRLSLAEAWRGRPAFHQPFRIGEVLLAAPGPAIRLRLGEMERAGKARRAVARTASGAPVLCHGSPTGRQYCAARTHSRVNRRASAHRRARSAPPLPSSTLSPSAIHR